MSIFHTCLYDVTFNMINFIEKSSVVLLTQYSFQTTFLFLLILLIIFLRIQIKVLHLHGLEKYQL